MVRFRAQRDGIADECPQRVTADNPNEHNAARRSEPAHRRPTRP